MPNPEKLPWIYRPVVLDQPVQDLLDVAQEEGMEGMRTGLRLDILIKSEMLALSGLSDLALKGLKIVLRREVPDSFHSGMPVFVGSLRAPRRPGHNMYLNISPTQELEDERQAVIRIIREWTPITIPEDRTFTWRVLNGRLDKRHAELTPRDRARLQMHSPDLLNLAEGVVD